MQPLYTFRREKYSLKSTYSNPPVINQVILDAVQQTCISLTRNMVCICQELESQAKYLMLGIPSFS